MAPPAVVEVATQAASLIGSGLYGVDVKETENGAFVVEINDNPNIDAGLEDAVLKDDLYRAILGELVERLEKRMQTGGRSRPDQARLRDLPDRSDPWRGDALRLANRGGRALR